ncbi:MAG: hypothetical protein HOV80_11145 [Polyangiaceae bacterium]|nr:hypothetical protein [Polyangiaceae bacterium]
MRRPLIGLVLVLLPSACAAGNTSEDGAGGSDDDGTVTTNTGAGGDLAPGTGGTGAAGGEGTGGDGVGGGTTPVELGPPLKVRETAPLVLVDTRGGNLPSCGTFPHIEGGTRQIVIDLDDCNLGDEAADAVGVIGAVTLRTDSTESLDVRIRSTDHTTSPPLTVGPLVSRTHGFSTMLGSTDRAFVIDVSGSATADVVLELTALLVPEASGGSYVHLLDQPLRWYASNPNDDGYREPWYRLDTVLEYPVLGIEDGATGMFGAVHLGPGVWRDTPVSFHMGGASDDPNANLTTWSTAPSDAHFPWRYSSVFTVGASNGQVEMRSSSEHEPPYESGIEPWIDAVGWLSPSAIDGLVYRKLEQPLTATVTTTNDETVRFTTGIPEARGVVGTLVFDLPQWNTPQGYRWFHVMVGATEDTFPGALGGGLEGPDWMTAALNQNGKVTTRFISRTDEDGQFVMRHYAFTSGGATGTFYVPTEVHVEFVLTNP